MPAAGTSPPGALPESVERRGRHVHPHPRSADPVRLGEGAGPRGGGQPGHCRDAAWCSTRAPASACWRWPSRPASTPTTRSASAPRAARSPGARSLRAGQHLQGLRRRAGARRRTASPRGHTFDCENGAWEVREVRHPRHPSPRDAERRPDPRRLLEHQGSQDRLAARARGMMRTSRHFGFGERTALGLPVRPRAAFPSPRRMCSWPPRRSGRGSVPLRSRWLPPSARWPTRAS